MTSATETAIVLLVALAVLGLKVGILWLAYLAYRGRSLRKRDRLA